MRILIYGEEIVKSRQQLDLIKSQHQGAEILNLDGKRINLSEIKQALESQSLLSSSRLVILENLSGNKKSAEILDYLKTYEFQTDLVIWEGKEVNKTFLKLLPQTQILVFKPETILFRLMEAIRPKNTEEMLRLFEKCLKREAVEIIFHMLVRQTRMLMMIMDQVTPEAEELARLAPWQKERLVRQAKFFTQEKLVDLYHQLLEIDYQQKTGLASFDLTKTLELFLTEI